MFNVYPFI